MDDTQALGPSLAEQRALLVSMLVFALSLACGIVVS